MGKFLSGMIDEGLSPDVMKLQLLDRIHEQLQKQTAELKLLVTELLRHGLRGD